MNQIAYGLTALGLVLLIYFMMKKNNKKISQDHKNLQSLTLSDKKQTAHNTYIFRFKLPSENDTLNLPIGNHIWIHYNDEDYEIKRAYTPISLNHEIGYVDLAIKIYFPTKDYPQGGIISQYLHSLSLGNTIDISWPRGKIKYEGYGSQFLITDEGLITIDNITMIAGGTGITPMYQIIRYITLLKNDKTKISLIYANRSRDDIMLYEELKNFKKNLGEIQFKIHFILTNPPSEWNEGKGKINKKTIYEHAWLPSESTIALICGRPAINDTMMDLLEEVGYKANKIYLF
ncbi:hypothetical protein HZS_2861 [Henneguya salminicola]|nr:hypothetical protein HZS_2861 [Henneguya salminicola]